MSRPLDWLDRDLPAPYLTDSGRARRAEMRGMLQGALSHRRRRRRGIRAASALALAAVAVLLWPRAGAPPDGGAAPRLRNLVYDAVGNDPAVLERYAVSPVVRPETRIGDDELLGLLGSDDRRTGLIRVGGKVVLTENVTDELAN